MANRSLLGWRSGGFLLLLAGVFILIALAWRISWILPTISGGPEAQPLAAVGFDLDPLLVDRRFVAASGLRRDGIPSLDDPAVIDVAGVAAVDAAHRGKYLVSSDRVLGVLIGGQARAYPLRVLNWHEVVNDTLGGVPIAVTYSPLCDSAVVFDRRVGGDTLEFGVSGLLFHSNLLMYDRSSDPARSSLWSQLQARAIAGPAAGSGTSLEVLPASLVRWKEWVSHHPSTSVLEPHPDRLKRYQRDTYGSYLAKGELRFPARLPPEGDGPARMRPILVVEQDGRFEVHALDGDDGRAPGETPVAISILDDDVPRSVLVGAESVARTYYSRRFAWFAQHPPGDRPGSSD